MRWQPSLQIIPHYESHPLYIEALINSIKNKIKTISWTPDLIIASYHGIPKSYFDKGDPYQCYCQKTTRLMKEKFLDFEIRTTFQSRFGPREWLKPYTDDELVRLAKTGKKRMVIVTPAFVTDCLETLEEIEMEGKEEFLEAGGESYHYVPCLNDDNDWAELISKWAN